MKKTLKRKLSANQVADRQIRWIERHISKEAADHCNLGWFVDEVNHTFSTKVYGDRPGVVTTDWVTGETMWESWS